MIKFKYSALDERNEIIKGQIDAYDEIEAQNMIAEIGYKPIRLTMAGLGSGSAKDKIKKMSSDEIALFCKQLSIITKSGISIIKGLLLVRNQSDNKKMKLLAENLHMGIQKGCSLSEAMKNCGFRLPMLLINMVQVGEASGNLDDIFKKMSAYFEKESKTKKKIIGAMTYPGILLVGSIGVIALFSFLILPQMMELVIDSGGKMPVITKFMMDSADFVKNNILYMLIGAAILITLYLKALPYEFRRKIVDVLFFKTPGVAGVTRDFMTARLTKTMGILIETGLSMMSTLETLERVMGNETISKGIAGVRDGINKGESLSKSMEQMGYFDNMVINIMAIGEDTGNLGESLLDLADYYDEKFDTGVTSLVGMIEPIFTLGMGAIIGTILLSSMLPMFNMISTMGGQ